MIIDTDTKEGKALVAQAKFGSETVHLLNGRHLCFLPVLVVSITEFAAQKGLGIVLGNDPLLQFVETDLAKLPEGLWPTN